MRLLVNTAKAKPNVWRMAKALLRERIKEARQQKLCLEKQVALETDCIYTLPGGATTAVQLERWASWHGSRVHKEVKERQRKKFECLMLSKRQRQRETLDRDRLVVNLSSQQLTEAQHDDLALGLNFATAPKRIPVEDIITRTEQTARRLNEEDGQTLREGVQRCLREAKTPEPTLTCTERKALKELQDLSRCEGLTILPADKGNATVVMDSAQYASKLEDLLTEDSYRLLPRNPTARTEKWGVLGIVIRPD